MLLTPPPLFVRLTGTSQRRQQYSKAHAEQVEQEEERAESDGLVDALHLTQRQQSPPGPAQPSPQITLFGSSSVGCFKPRWP